MPPPTTGPKTPHGALDRGLLSSDNRTKFVWLNLRLVSPFRSRPFVLGCAQNPCLARKTISMRVASRLVLLLAGFAAVTAHAQIFNFKHIVVVVQENRTPDNLFQGLCSPPYGACAAPPTFFAPYDIQTSNWQTKTGTVQPAPVALASTYDLDHSHRGFDAMCNVVAGNPPTCLMNGAAGIGCHPKAGTTCPARPQFRYVNNSTGVLNPYLELASQYGWANYMFQTNQGPSFPAHQFIFGGTSAPSKSDDALGIFASENMIPTSAQAGCAAKPTT